MSVSSWIRRQFKNGVSVSDTVPSGFSSGATSFVAADGTTFPDGSVGPFIVTADEGLATEEKILCASRSGATFTVAAGGRGYNGTTAFTHGAGATILHTIDAQDLDEANRVAVATLGQIAAQGDLLYGTAANALGRLPVGSANEFLVSSGSAPEWAVLTLTQAEQIFTADQQILSGTGANTAELIDLLVALKEYSSASLLGLVEKVYVAAGDIVVGTGAGTGTILSAGSTPGMALRSAGSAQQPVYEAAPNHAGHLASDTTMSNAAGGTVFLTTASLAVGTWLVNFSAILDMGKTALENAEIEAAVGTATATFEGSTVGSASVAATTSNNDVFATVSFTFIATVTVAGTLTFKARDVFSSTVIKAASPGALAASNATGYTAVQL